MAAILGQLDDDRDLYAALQVNRMWANEAITLLWRVKPPIWAFAQVEGAERLQYYANKISVVDLSDISDDQEGHWTRCKTQGLLFPCLSEIFIDLNNCDCEDVLLRYLQPGLQKLSLRGWLIPDDFLTRVEEQCPALRSFSLHSLKDAMTAEHLLRFLNGMPSLVEIVLGNYVGDPMCEKLSIHLASRPNLVRFKTLMLNRIRGMRGGIDQLFPDLLFFCCVSRSKVFSQFSHHLTRLTQLDLTVIDAARETIFDICSCTHLVNLVLTFRSDSHFDTKTHLPPEGLLVLAQSCSHLQTFSVVDDMDVVNNDGAITKITDDVIRDFVKLLPGLTSFSLKVKTNLTHRALIVLGNGCANLEYCSLYGESFPLRSFKRKISTLFPRLKYLELRPVEEGPQSDVASRELHLIHDGQWRNY